MSALNLPEASETLSNIGSWVEFEKSREKLSTEDALMLLSNTLKNREYMKSIWIHMHTEKLLIFDKYIDVKIEGGRMSCSWNECKTRIPLVFVSYRDMCSACEDYMEWVNSKKMESASFGNFRLVNYKILVGAFKECGRSSERDGKNNILKVRLTSVPSAGVRGPSSAPKPISRATPQVPQIIVVPVEKAESSSLPAAAAAAVPSELTKASTNPFGEI